MEGFVILLAIGACLILAVNVLTTLLDILIGMVKEKPRCKGHKWERLNNDELYCIACEKTFKQIIMEKDEQ